MISWSTILHAYVMCDVSLPKGHSLRNLNDKCDITGSHKTRDLTISFFVKI